MNKKIVKHFQKNDPVLFSVILKIKKHHTLKPTLSNDYFLSLCREIINQQLSDKVAHVIFERFLHLFPKHKVNPQLLLEISDATLRGIGTSWAKVKYIKDLAQKVVNGEVLFDTLKNLDNEEVIVELTKIKGIGRWTAEMFLMFSLGREDVFPYSDLGLRKAIQKLYGFKKEPTRSQAEIVAKNWSPYKTYACRILWRSLEVK